jgi:hypothetical protein
VQNKLIVGLDGLRDLSEESHGDIGQDRASIRRSIAESTGGRWSLIGPLRWLGVIPHFEHLDISINRYILYTINIEKVAGI